MSKSGSELGRMLCRNCRYVGVISPDITISNHRLRWAVHGMRFTAPLLWQNGLEVLHLFRCSTHTPRQAGLKTEVPTVRWRWGWQGDESEMRIRRWDENYLTETRDGERQKREEEPRENTNTNTPCPERANPEKAREKKKRRPTEEHKDKRRGGRTDAPEPT